MTHGFSGQTGAYKWAKLVKHNKAIYIIKTGLRKVKMKFRAYLTLSQPGWQRPQKGRKGLGKVNTTSRAYQTLSQPGLSLACEGLPRWQSNTIKCTHNTHKHSNTLVTLNTLKTFTYTHIHWNTLYVNVMSVFECICMYVSVFECMWV